MELPALLSSMWRSKTGPFLVAAQVALALAVLVNVTYVIVLRFEAINQPSGLDLPHMFWVQVQSTSHDAAKDASNPSDTDAEAATAAAITRADLAWLNALPGVVAAATTLPLPQGFGSLGLPFSSDPAELAKPGGGHGAGIYMGSERYLEALGLRLVAGRHFSASAVQPPQRIWGTALEKWAPEIILTRVMAQELFPHESALGKTVYAGLINKPAVVVGIVDGLRSGPASPQFDRLAQEIVLVPIASSDTYIVRAAPGRRAELMRTVEQNLAGLAPNRFIARIEAYDVTAGRARAGLRASIIILAVVAALVLTVTIVGIVGLAAYNVTSRTKQLGTRRALGARRFHIVRYFLVENWLTTTLGVIVGCGAALAGGVWLARAFQNPQLPLYYLAGGVLVLWLVGLAAVWLPARRAARVSPAVATRTV